MHIPALQHTQSTAFKVKLYKTCIRIVELIKVKACGDILKPQCGDSLIDVGYVHY